MKIIYWQSAKNKQWYFHLKARNNKIIAQSEGYEDRQACLKTAGLLMTTKQWSLAEKPKEGEEDKSLSIAFQKKRYLLSSCTDSECRLCRTPKPLRHSGQRHVGLSAYTWPEEKK